MAPEYPPGLVVFDARFEQGQIVGNLQYVEVPIRERLRVRWDTDQKPDGFVSICDGVVFVESRADLEILPISFDSRPDRISDNKYRWTEGLNEGIPWVMMIIILPKGFSFSNALPKPSRVKVFNADRIASYWILKGDEIGRTFVELTLFHIKNSLDEEIIRINDRLTSYSEFPENRNIEIMDDDAQHKKRKTNPGHAGRSDTTIKIFLASSSELVGDRKKFREFISIENDELFNKGIYLKLDQWEYSIDAMTKDGLQSEYNKMVKECDIFVSLFFTKVGKFTAEEFENAFGQFKDTGKPHIYTYFKDAPVQSTEIKQNDFLSKVEFENKLIKLGHYKTIYTHNSDLHLHFKRQLEKLINKYYKA